MTTKDNGGADMPEKEIPYDPSVLQIVEPDVMTISCQCGRGFKVSLKTDAKDAEIRTLQRAVVGLAPTAHYSAFMKYQKTIKAANKALAEPEPSGERKALGEG